MKTFDVQTIAINAPFEETFGYIAEAHNLPRWTSAFKSVSNGRAVMQTANGSVEIEVAVNAAREQGTIDWIMAFPDGNMAKAYSRVVNLGTHGSLYSFILMAPPVPLEELEGALEQQSQTLREELSRLRAILERRP
ncbi:SRPBCC family protein [candidate division KSB1 bacterium]|nr:SRPBCC family protein [candidate division KSB1 bacterium]